MTTLAPDEHALAMKIAEGVLAQMEHEDARKARAQAQLDALLCHLLPALDDDARVLMQCHLDHFVKYLRARSLGEFDAAEEYLTITTDFARAAGLAPGLALALADIRRPTT